MCRATVITRALGRRRAAAAAGGAAGPDGGDSTRDLCPHSLGVRHSAGHSNHRHWPRPVCEHRLRGRGDVGVEHVGGNDLPGALDARPPMVTCPLYTICIVSADHHRLAKPTSSLWVKPERHPRPVLTSTRLMGKFTGILLNKPMPSHTPVSPGFVAAKPACKQMPGATRFGNLLTAWRCHSAGATRKHKIPARRQLGRGKSEKETESAA